MSSQSDFLQIIDVYKAYNGKVILDNIDFQVSRGEFCTVVGPSGCGKSTLLRLIVGAEIPTAGRVLLEQQSVGPPDIHRGIVFQRYSLFPHLTVLDNVSLGLRLGGRPGSKEMSGKEIQEEATAMLEKIRLAEHGNKYPHELSGGMQQRVAIGQSLIMKPKILVMDEPFGALDPDTREDMQLFLMELWEQEKMTVFFVTHDLAEAAFLGTRLIVLSQYYTDDRGSGGQVNRGAKITADYQLPDTVSSTAVKQSKEFTELIDCIRREGFDPDFLQHAQEFNLKHPDSFQTLTRDESGRD
ncbi:NitT/TauT family transport system ATP-binding protein [Candidatus Electrothrix marina]|uniref:NitT/TauT family transport system ATP-binding protein n=1 Tax=Candidatus Electrothrix marina TaxID=1859130 RepID=A0A3S3QTZ2_9BACT|nr:NitT/TauT family transport system ATP-binding protein [Candidatus Electrothrix marina]